jgi:hypothetical protein
VAKFGDDQRHLVYRIVCLSIGQAVQWALKRLSSPKETIDHTGDPRIRKISGGPFDVKPNK